VNVWFGDLFVVSECVMLARGEECYERYERVLSECGGNVL